MAAAILHRGPDEDGYYERPGLHLANRRLSIVGLADGRQPIFNEDRSIAVVFEAAGRSLLGPLAINGAAPDEGNMRLLSRVASPAQRARYLEPLARGTIRSCWSSS